MNKIQQNFNRNPNHFSEENVLQNVVGETTVISLMTQCVKETHLSFWEYRHSNFSLHEKEFHYVVCDMSVIFTRPQDVNTSRPEQNCHHFADDSFKYI